MHVVLANELAARLGVNAAAFRDGADEDIPAMASLQAGLWTAGDAMGCAVRDVEEERMRLERAASLAHCGKLLAWMHKTCSIKCLRQRQRKEEMEERDDRSACHVNGVHAYVDGYGPAVNDLTSLWTQKCIFRNSWIQVTHPYKFLYL